MALILTCEFCGEEYPPDSGYLPGDDCPDLECPSHDDEAREGDICGTCNGSGEGMYDGSVCGHCGGSGELKLNGSEYDCDRDEYNREERVRDY